MEVLAKYGRSLYRNAVARERGYSVRNYQISAALRAVELATAGRNSAIELPTGTGKTLIACLAAAFWKRIRPRSRCLLVIPSRTLVVQHAEVARWIMPELRVGKIEDSQSGDPGSIRSTLLRADFLITTPGIVASSLRRQIVDGSYANSIDFVIADEFDSFVVSDELEFETQARFAVNWASLRAQLPAKTKFLVKSATLNLSQDKSKSQRGVRSARHARMIMDELKPIPIAIPESEYAAVIPHQSLRAVSCNDAWIAELVGAIAMSKGILHAQLNELVGGTDYGTVERTAPQICQRPHLLPARYRKYSPELQNRIIGLYCGITTYKMMPQHIFEDLTGGLSTKIQTARIMKTDGEVVLVKDGVFLDDQRAVREFEFERRGKSEILAALLRGFKKKALRPVIFCRTIRLLNALKAMLEGARLNLFQLTGEMLDEERAAAIANFRKSKAGVLLMTRTTGGRGLDLPFADCAVFYSPKTDTVQMWQEMSRIRSTVSKPKETFVMCYAGTVEPATFTDTIIDLKQRNLRADAAPPALERFIDKRSLRKLPLVAASGLV